MSATGRLRHGRFVALEPPVGHRTARSDRERRNGDQPAEGAQSALISNTDFGDIDGMTMKVFLARPNARRVDRVNRHGSV